MTTELKATEDKNLEILIQDLRLFADKPVGSIRIDMSDVRSILRLYDGTRHHQADDATVERAAKAYAEATGYYTQFHRGLSSPSADKIRVGIKAAIAAMREDR